MEKIVIKIVEQDYKEFLKENEFENTLENINLYIAGLYYDIMDNLDLTCQEFRVPKEIEGYEAEKYIEGQIKNILLKI